MVTEVAPASIEFSTSSLMTDAGRWITSPAATPLATESGRRRMISLARSPPFCRCQWCRGHRVWERTVLRAHREFRVPDQRVRLAQADRRAPEFLLSQAGPRVPESQSSQAESQALKCQASQAAGGWRPARGSRRAVSLPGVSRKALCALRLKRSGASGGSAADGVCVGAYLAHEFLCFQIGHLCGVVEDFGGCHRPQRLIPAEHGQIVGRAFGR